MGFNESFEWPSEVYRLIWPRKDTTLVFRDKTPRDGSTLIFRRPARLSRRRRTHRDN